MKNILKILVFIRITLIKLKSDPFAKIHCEADGRGNDLKEGTHAYNEGKISKARKIILCKHDFFPLFNLHDISTIVSELRLDCLFHQNNLSWFQVGICLFLRSSQHLLKYFSVAWVSSCVWNLPSLATDQKDKEVLSKVLIAIIFISSSSSCLLFSQV